MLHGRRQERRPDRSSWLSWQGGDDVATGRLVRFFPQGNRQYGFISPDNGRAVYDSSDEDYFDNYEQSSKEDIFVHLDVLRKGTREGVASRAGYPQPGQKLRYSDSCEVIREQLVGVICVELS